MDSSESGSMQRDSASPVSARCEKSSVAREIENLQETVNRFTRDRERLPQPLFWSLFNTRIREIKKSKEISRAVKEALGEL